MKKIQIETTQNVMVQYEIASVPERMLALVIDIITIGVANSILSFVFGALSFQAASFITFFLVIFYSLIFESLNRGQTLGKMAMRLKVIKINGEQSQFFDYLTRWSTKGFEVYLTLGSLAGLSSLLSPKGQRIGDVLANTVVIKHEKIGRLNFSRLIDLDKYSDYEPVYPEVVQLNEDDVLLIHETYNRYKKNNTEGHKQALILLVKSLKVKLDLPDAKNAEKFVRQLIKDYVILTR